MLTLCVSLVFCGRGTLWTHLQIIHNLKISQSASKAPRDHDPQETRLLPPSPNLPSFLLITSTSCNALAWQISTTLLHTVHPQLLQRKTSTTNRPIHHQPTRSSTDYLLRPPSLQVAPAPSTWTTVTRTRPSLLNLLNHQRWRASPRQPSSPSSMRKLLCTPRAALLGAPPPSRDRNFTSSMLIGLALFCFRLP